MKYIILLLLAQVHAGAFAQQLRATIKDSLPAKAVIKNNLPVTKTPAPSSLQTTIEKELNTILSAYMKQPNNAATWIQVKAAAENMLYTYFLNGKLMGTKKEQAFYIKMGTETMTAADIAAGKRILICGVALYKPAEFTIIKIEKLP